MGSASGEQKPRAANPGSGMHSTKSALPHGTVDNTPSPATPDIQFPPRDAESQSTLLSLPLEVRYEVYTHLFASSKLSCGTPHPSPPCPTICTCQYPSQITRVNRQLRLETLPFLHSATTLEVQGPLRVLSVIPNTPLSHISALTIRSPKLFNADGFAFARLCSLRTLEVHNLIVWCKFYDEVFLESAQADLTMLDMALFNVQRVNRGLAEVCKGSASRGFRVLLHCQFVVNSLSDETIHALIDVDDQRIISKMRGPPEKNFNSWSGFY